MHVWRERLGRWFTPLALRCPLSPNAITVIALVINIGAALCFVAGSKVPTFFLVGMALLVVGGLADALDGIVARVQNKSSRYGDFLDHFADRVSDTFLIAGWMIGSGIRMPLAMLALIMVMLNGYTGTQIEATWSERRYEVVGRGEFVLAMIVFPIVSYILASNGWTDASYLRLSIPEWLTVLLVVFGLLGIFQRLGIARRMPRE